MTHFPDSHTSFEGRGRQFCTMCPETEPHYFCPTINPEDKIMSKAIKLSFLADHNEGNKVLLGMTYLRDTTIRQSLSCFSSETILDIQKALNKSLERTYASSPEDGKELEIFLKQFGFTKELSFT